VKLRTFWRLLARTFFAQIGKGHGESGEPFKRSASAPAGRGGHGRPTLPSLSLLSGMTTQGFVAITLAIASANIYGIAYAAPCRTGRLSTTSLIIKIEQVDPQIPGLLSFACRSFAGAFLRMRLRSKGRYT